MECSAEMHKRLGAARGHDTQAVASGGRPRRTARGAACGARDKANGLHTERLPNRREVKGVPVAMSSIVDHLFY